MNAFGRFKTVMSILMLYASNIIVHDKNIVPIQYNFSDVKKRITARKFLQLPAPDNV